MDSIASRTYTRWLNDKVTMLIFITEDGRPPAFYTGAAFPNYLVAKTKAWRSPLLRVGKILISIFLKPRPARKS